MGVFPRWQNVKIENVLVRWLPLTAKILLTEEVTSFCDKSFKPEKNSTYSFVNIHLYQVFINQDRNVRFFQVS